MALARRCPEPSCPCIVHRQSMREQSSICPGRGDGNCIDPCLLFSLPPLPDWAAVTGLPLSLPAPRKHADCPQLLDVEDMVRMREPDWKCVYTYIQEFYRCLVQKGLVKTKKS